MGEFLAAGRRGLKLSRSVKIVEEQKHCRSAIADSRIAEGQIPVIRDRYFFPVLGEKPGHTLTAVRTSRRSAL